MSSTIDSIAVETSQFPSQEPLSPIDNGQTFAEILQQVSAVIAPVWPLRDYVAVNPYFGIAERSFMDARLFLRVFSDCETLMPLGYYVDQFRNGSLGRSDIELAIGEVQSQVVGLNFTVENVLEKLKTHVTDHSEDLPDAQPRQIQTVAERFAPSLNVNWREVITDEISKHCSTYYDQGQAVWANPFQHLNLYAAWKEVSEHDYSVELLGMTGFRQFVGGLPESSAAAIELLLKRLGVPRPLWSTFLLCQAFSIPGWCAWTKYQSSWNDGVENDDFCDLLAIRLAYDVALAEAKSLTMDWCAGDLIHGDSATFVTSRVGLDDNAMLRYLLLHASEIRYRNELLQSMSSATPRLLSKPTDSVEKPVSDEESLQRKSSQIVFCIDVRSERIRRNLESLSADIETFGFAGFFGMPIEFVKLGEKHGDSHLPVLLKPKFQVREGFANDGAVESAVTLAKQETNGWKKLWKKFQSSAPGCFAFVETIGLFFAGKLLGKSLQLGRSLGSKRSKEVQTSGLNSPGLRMDELESQGISELAQIDMAEGMLQNLGLTDGFARLVVFSGHSSKTENNPLAAGLDCGACGGHSGEPNARFAAMLLNQKHVRDGLQSRDIKIPHDTFFVGALHNTTTDEIEFLDEALLPETHTRDMEELKSQTKDAGELTRLERTPLVASNRASDIFRRATDWSEVRPEWGLAGNASFIVAPRQVTKSLNLSGRSFLHSYDFEKDVDGTILETIMTAPMIVANWINMQYYASAVDNSNFGSGNKTVHNVVGRFGVLSGNSGDLMTGLPMQSLHTGKRLQHLPMRLQVVIAAPRDSIERIVARHEVVGNLVNGGWLHLVAIEDGSFYRYNENSTNGVWEPVAMTADNRNEMVTLQDRKSELVSCDALAE